jgi:Ser/Thr protein kinase RdoA (MazF antagonist)
MSSQNEAHGDEDWMDVSDDAVHESAIEIICDPQLLESQLNDTELVAPLADLCACIDKACHGDPTALNALTRAGSQLKRVLMAIVDDKAYQIALNRQLNDE